MAAEIFLLCCIALVFVPETSELKHAAFVYRKDPSEVSAVLIRRAEESARSVQTRIRVAIAVVGLGMLAYGWIRGTGRQPGAERR